MIMTNELAELPLRICSFESRRGSEMKSLIERHSCVATIAPSMREIPLEDNPAAFAFADELLAGKIDVTLFMTGVGASALIDSLETRYSRAQIFVALEKTTIVVRGPKPTAILRGWGVRIDHRAPEPNTWREVVGVFDESIPIKGRRVAVQEYGLPSVDMYRAFEERGASVLPVPVYRWALPVDTEPLKSAIRQTIAGELDVLMFTSAQQLSNVLQVADEMGLRAEWLQVANDRCVIASIGPTATEALKAGGLRVDLEPSHPNMGALVKETAQQAGEIRRSRRG
jgi:uroporphyrinogen-III synthase